MHFIWVMAMDRELRILMLEDNPADAEIIQFEIQEAEIAFTAKVVTDEADFIRGLQDFAPDIILSDYDLPRYNGAAALAEAKKRRPDVPFILVTGAMTEEKAIETLTSGARDFVMKGRLGKLAPAIRRAVEEANEHKARKEAEEEVRAASLYTRSLIEASLDPLVTISPEGKITDVNTATEEVTGLFRDQIIGTDFSDYFTEPDKARAGYARVFAEGSVKDYSLSIRHTSGRITEVLYNANIYRNERGEVEGIFAAARDVTELKRTEEELRKAYRHLEDTVQKRTVALEAEVVERRKVERTLRKSEQRERQRAAELAALLDAAPMPIFIAHDRDCTHLTGNKAAEDLLNMPRGSETSLSAPVADRPTHFKAIKNGRELRNEELPAQRAAKGVPVRDFEFDLAFDDKTVRHVLGYGTPLADDKGHPRGAVHVLVDITGRKKAEMERRTEQDRLQMALEAADAVLWEWEISTRSIRYSENLRGMVRGDNVKPYSSLDELLSMIHPEDRERLVEALDRASTEGVPFECEYRVQMVDGKYRWILGKGKRVVMEGGKPVRVLGLSVDVTERKQTDEALRESRERLRYALETSHTGAWDLNLQNHTASRSLEHDRIFGYSELLPQWTYEMFLDHVVPEDRDEVDARFRKAVQTGSDWNFDCRIRRTDGEIRWIWASGCHRRAAHGEHYVTGIVQDITERKRAEELLRKANDELEERVCESARKNGPPAG
jgi:PAS domain S-box-containing protein